MTRLPCARSYQHTTHTHTHTHTLTHSLIHAHAHAHTHTHARAHTHTHTHTHTLTHAHTHARMRTSALNRHRLRRSISPSPSLARSCRVFITFLARARRAKRNGRVRRVCVRASVSAYASTCSLYVSQYALLRRDHQFVFRDFCCCFLCDIIYPLVVYGEFIVFVHLYCRKLIEFHYFLSWHAHRVYLSI
jgi:hypothetical protein